MFKTMFFVYILFCRSKKNCWKFRMHSVHLFLLKWYCIFDQRHVPVASKRKTKSMGLSVDRNFKKVKFLTLVGIENSY